MGELRGVGGRGGHIRLPCPTAFVFGERHGVACSNAFAVVPAAGRASAVAKQRARRTHAARTGL
jgi:hypothetical protein